MAQQSVTGSEEPVLSTVLASTLRVKWFRSANSHKGQQLNAASQAGQMAAADYAPLQLPLASIGASTDGKPTSVLRQVWRFRSLYRLGNGIVFAREAFELTQKMT